MATFETGSVQVVFTEQVSTTLAADAASAATSITLDDAADFDALNGGTLQLGGVQYAYTALDDDTGVATLATGLTAAASEGDAVYVWDTGKEAIATQVHALVELPGDQAGEDTIDALIPGHLAATFPAGVRAPDQQEPVTMQRQGGDEWVIVSGPRSAGATLSKEWSAKGTVSSETGTHALYNDTGTTLALVKVRVAFTAGNGPAGGTFSVQVQRNGSDVLSTPVTVADGDLTATGFPDLITTWPDGTYLTVVITSTASGTDPVVTVVVQ